MKLFGVVRGKIRLPRSVDVLFYTDEHNAVIAIRGTHEKIDDLGGTDAEAKLVSGEAINVKGKLHEGFYEHAKYIIEHKNFGAFLAQVKEKKKNLFVTGHSMGGAVATILSAYFNEQGLDPLLYTYGSPRAGDLDFVSAYADITHYRHFNDGDIIPIVPGRFVDGGKDSLRTGILCGAGLILTGNFLAGFIVIAGVTAIGTYNFIGDDYTHHGNLCQIIGGSEYSKISDDIRMIIPFSAHYARSEFYLKYRDNSQEIILLQDKREQLVVEMDKAISKGDDKEANDLSKKVRDIITHIDELEEQNEKVEELPDRDNEEYKYKYEDEDKNENKDERSSLLSPSFGLAQHSMDVYLSNLEKIIKPLWKFYSQTNNYIAKCSKDCSGEALSHLSDEIKQELQRMLDILNKDRIKSFDINQESNLYLNNTVLYPRAIYGLYIDEKGNKRWGRIQSKKGEKEQEQEDAELNADYLVLKEVLEADLDRIEKLQKVKIEHKSLYGLFTGDNEIVTQLNLLIGKQWNS
ncbi:lipase family protein [Pasteurella atlantica]|uniref:lipase family protein n=1 Tax=Pasteurella atlantica TaxID=2827233 RepID=UPI002746AADD|nr:lipase family protein [Pasteurella atlantica]MDP8105760.1 lipase family protein [Pasteurella atlantica]